MAAGKCLHSWDSNSNVILIAPKRFSGGGHKIVNQLLQKIKGSPASQKFKFVQLKGKYKYCSYLSYRGKFSMLQKYIMWNMKFSKWNPGSLTAKTLNAEVILISEFMNSEIKTTSTKMWWSAPYFWSSEFRNKDLFSIQVFCHAARLPGVHFEKLLMGVNVFSTASPQNFSKKIIPE